MKSFSSKYAVILLSFCLMSFYGCSPKSEESAENGDSNQKAKEVASLPGLPPVVETHDKIDQEILDFPNQICSLVDNRNFDKLEAIAYQLRKEKSRFGNGSSKLYRFYVWKNYRGCSKEPENVWKLHEQIFKEWIAAKPSSITARVAYASFLTDYAWHARGAGWANTVTKEGWHLFEARLAEAHKVLDESASLEEKCPMWWSIRMVVALGEGWDRKTYEKMFSQAKALEPDFWNYDVQRSWYLMPRWYGEPGDWEAAAEAEAKRPGSLGAEVYARVVSARSDNYKDSIFKETKASWPETRKGFEVLRKKYPDSLLILSNFCQLACLAGERDLAKQLFDEIGGRMESEIWDNKNYFIKCRNWAYSK